MNMDSALPLLLLKSNKNDDIYYTIIIYSVIDISRTLKDKLLEKLKKTTFRRYKSQIISTACIQTVIKNFISMTPEFDYMAMSMAILLHTNCNKKRTINMFNIGNTYYSHSSDNGHFRLIPDIGFYKTFDGKINFEVKEEDSSTTENSINDKNTIKERKYNKSYIIISSNILTQKELEEYRDKIILEYKNYEKLRTIQTVDKYIFTLAAPIKDTWQETIDNGFEINKLQMVNKESWVSEEHKENFMYILEKLIDTEYYNKRGLCRGFKAYLYGPPGTGKTSCCRWIASQAYNSLALLSEEERNYYKKNNIELNIKGRHIVSLNLNFIDSYKVLLHLLTIKKIGNVNFSSWDDIVFVVDEADLSDIKKESSKEVVKNDMSVKEESNSDEKLKKLLEACVETNKISIGLYLQILDGLIQMPGIIIIFTSNTSPEGLPPALFRNCRLKPYRIGESTRKDIKDMIKLHWEVDISDEQCLRIPHKKITNTTLLCLLNEKHVRTKNIDDLINDMCES